MGTPKQIIAFCHFKGGVGSSFLASNVAYELAKNKILTCLIDFDTKLPSCANILGLEVKKEKSMYRFFTNTESTRKGECFISDKKLSSYLYLISSSSEDEVEILEDINDSGDDVNNLLNIAHDTFDIVIIDLPVDYMNPQIIGSLEKADKVIVIGDLDINTIENSFRSLQLYKSIDIPLSKFEYIPNKFFANNDITLPTIKETLGIRVGTTVPFDYFAVFNSIIKSSPIVDTNGPLTDAIRSICSMITGNIAFDKNDEKDEVVEFGKEKDEIAPTLFTFVEEAENEVASTKEVKEEGGTINVNS